MPEITLALFITLSDLTVKAFCSLLKVEIIKILYLIFRNNTIAKIVPLIWIKEPNDLTINAEKELRIECKANGLPKPTIKWISSKGLHLCVFALSFIFLLLNFD
jgi:hypothetical protein